MENRALTRRGFWLAIAVSAGIAAATLCIAPLVGSASISFERAFAGASPDKEILFYTRLPRVLLALLAGGALGVAGVLFQAMLRDALATPYTLGVSSGAALGAVIAICMGWSEVARLPAVWVCAFLGAALVLTLVLGIATEGKRMSSFTLLLAGVSINTICLACILFLQYIATFGQTFAIVRWMMGGIDAVDYSTLAWLGAAVLPALGLIFAKAREWNLMAVGEEWAAARGVNTSRLILTGYLLGSFIAGSITAITGPIAFVGLIVPHALRLRLGADHRILIPCSFLLGSSFLAICDTMARTVLAPTEIPVGVVTALLGGPFFIWLLRSKRRSLWL
ncbi:MAG TPA: iron ABC transporter permease [Bryobacteraceae bacterium]|nr:iron ABC transporter permease [Bryobacteraceae bacterium]HPU72053.1 iron ABC transporter permease [Bryobacteraceae bacterium]